MGDPTKIPAIPNVPSDAGSLKPFLSAVKESLEVGLGRRGDSLDQNVTLRRLVSMGAIIFDSDGTPVFSGSGVTVIAGGGGGGGGPDAPDLTPPPVPTGLSATSSIESIFFEIDSPVYTVGHGNRRTRVYAASGATPTFSDAVYIGSIASTGTLFVDNVGPGVQRHYWAVFESVDGIQSTPSGGTNGVSATTPQSPNFYLTALNGAITSDELATSLGSRIDLIDAPGTGLVTATSTISSRLDNAGGAGITVEQQFLADASSITGLNAKYTIKIDSNGYVSGFGLASTSNTSIPISEFVIRADKFKIASPSGPGITPIVPFSVFTTPQIEDGVTFPVGVYMDAAYIRDLTAMVVRVRGLTADNITAGSITGDRISGTTLAAVKASLGIVSVDVNGYLATNGVTSYSAGAAGVFLGYDTGLYRFRVGGFPGSGTAGAGWNGSSFQIWDTAGSLVLSSGTGVPWTRISGAGRPADNATSDIVLVGRGVAVSGNSATKATGIAAWDSDVSSRDSFVGGAFAAAVPAQANAYITFGLNHDPLTDSSYTSLDYAWFCTNTADLQIYESGVGLGSFGTYAANDVLAIVYDGAFVRYTKNGAVLRTVPAPPGLALFFDSSFFTVGGVLNNIRFGPMSQIDATAVTASNPINSSNIGTYIASLTVDTIHIKDAAVTDIVTYNIGNVASASQNTPLLGTNPVVSVPPGAVLISSLTGTLDATLSDADYVACGNQIYLFASMTLTDNATSAVLYSVTSPLNVFGLQSAGGGGVFIQGPGNAVAVYKNTTGSPINVQVATQFVDLTYFYVPIPSLPNHFLGANLVLQLVKK